MRNVSLLTLISCRVRELTNYLFHFGQSYVYRLYRGHERDPGSQIPVVSYFSVSAPKGLRMALKDLAIVFPSEFDFVKRGLHDVLAGIGADFYHTLTTG